VIKKAVMQSTKNKKRGGSLLGIGACGCVFEPVILCNGFTSAQYSSEILKYKKGVGIIMHIGKDADDEYDTMTDVSTVQI
jgi:hypothetical protein